MRLRNVFALVGAWLLVGCSAVYTPEPLGDKPVVLDSNWSGTWIADDSVATTTVLDSKKGLVQIAWLEAKADGIEKESFRVLLRSDGDVVFGNVRDAETENGYHWMLVDKKSNRHILAWLPDAERFRLLIEEGRLPGKVLNPEDENSDDVVLGELEQAHFDLIMDPGSGLMDWKNPVVLIKISE